MPATAANPRGHFESLPIVAMNEFLLAKVGSHWLVPPATSDDLRSCATDLTMRRAGLDALTAAGYSGDHQRFAIKDPRFCLTLPFWQEILTDEFTLIAMYRRPDEVIASLQSRDGLDPSYSRYLWDRYYEQLLSSLGTTPTVALSYHDLVPLSTSTDALLRENFPDLSGTDANSIDATLHRQKSEYSTHQPESTLWQQLEALGASARGPSEVLSSVPPPAQVSQATLAYLSSEWAQLRCALSSVQQSLARQRSVHAEQLSALRHEHGNLRSNLELVVSNARNDVATLQADIAILQAEQTALTSRLQQSQDALHAYEHSRAAGIARTSWRLKEKARARTSSD